MDKLRWMMCGVLLAVVGCAEVPSAPDEDEAVVESAVTSGPATTAADGCTTTESACRVGRCELGANDRFSILTETCCTNGVCETERYRLCGC